MSVSSGEPKSLPHSIFEPFSRRSGTAWAEVSGGAAWLRFFRPEGRAEAVDLAEGRGRGLVVELPALAEVGFLVEVLRLEKSRRPFARARRQDGRVHEAETASVEEVADGLDDLGPDTEDGMLFRGAEPEVAVLHQERGAVLFERDRIVLGHLDDIEVGDGQLESAGRPLVLADAAPDDERGLLGQPAELLTDGRVLVGAEGRRLDKARPVADEEEADLARRALVIKPAADFDVLAFVSRDVLDVDPFHDALIISQTPPPRNLGRRPRSSSTKVRRHFSRPFSLRAFPPSAAEGPRASSPSAGVMLHYA